MTEYSTPASVDEALSLLSSYEGEALVIAGGTDVLPDIRHGKRSPRCLVDVTRLPGMSEIVVERERVEVGAAVTFATLKSYPYFQLHIHALAQATGSVGTADIQNAATWGGNLVQAMPAADGVVVALALDAEVRVETTQGARWQPVARLFAGTGRSTIDPTREFITRIRFPIPDRSWGTGWRRIGRRDSLVLPILNCAVKLELADGIIAHAAIALGPVAPVPFRASAAEDFLLGKPPADSAFAQAADIVRQESNPRSSVTRASREYRLAALAPLVQDALFAAARHARLTT